MSDVRIVNLSEKPRVAVDLQLGGKTFRIARVVNAVRAIYGAMLKEAAVLMGKVDDLVSKQNELVGLNSADRAMVEIVQSGDLSAPVDGIARAKAEISRLTEEIEHFAARKNDQLMACIKLILESNGYAFDRQWWQDNGDEMDFQGFIVEALMKDSPAQKKTAEVAV